MKLRRLEKCFVASILTVCMISGLLFTGYGEVMIQAEETEQSPHVLSNPSYDADDDSNVTWDCVWFGSYPQTEIVSIEDTAQLAAMEKMNAYYETKYDKVSASDYQQIAGASYDSNGDTTVNGIKYRRIKKGDATKISTSSGYYQWTDSTSYHYFRYEKIKWRVLSATDGDAFLLADVGLDDKKYYESTVAVTWETCTLRSWLNGYSATSNKAEKDYSSDNFLDTAFSSVEQAAILNSVVVNADNSEYGTEGGNDTTDKIFLLSIDEAVQSDYGFSERSTNYDKARRAKTSTYAKAMGCYGSTSTTNAGCGRWLLRSPGEYASWVTMVNYNGCLDGDYVTGTINAVRPALHLNISSSSLYSYAGTVSSVEKKNENTEQTPDITSSEQVSSGTNATQTSSDDSSGQQPQNTTDEAGTKVTAPGKVKGVKLLKQGSGKLKVSFKKVKKAKGYQISYSTNKRFTKAKKITTKKNKYTIKKPKKGKNYYVRVRAYKLDGSRKVYGKWSKIKKKKVK